ncbi:MAG: hypothetical protein COB14_06585 [Alphaproteobacteria bacterium]|nr:MAG: hypothetical protein COB14_06585 [Alphaproteobacteria bacterium]
MSDEQPPREPALKPMEDAKFNTVRRKTPVNPEGHEPILMSEGLHHKREKPPYLMVALVLIGVLIAFWKMWMYGGEEEMDKKHAQAEITAQENLKSLRAGGFGARP